MGGHFRCRCQCKKRKKTPQEKQKAREQREREKGKAKAEAQKSTGLMGYLKGIYFTALMFLALFAVPIILSSCVTVYDWIYPDAAHEQNLRERLVACYEVADSSKLSNIDDLIEKTKDTVKGSKVMNRRKEIKLLQGLREKYGDKYSQCNYM